MDRVTLNSEDIKRLAKEAGFDLCGVVRAEYLPDAESRFKGWLSAGYGDGLEYLHRNLELRFDPSRLVDGARSIVVCGVNYKNRYSLSDELQKSGVGVASYALTRDYHKSIKRRFKTLFKSLQSLYPSLSGRPFTDSAPLLEKHFAYMAGLGWIGRQSLLVTPQFGTFVLLGELVIDHDVDHYDEPIGSIDGGCGECRRCIDSCPVGAINLDRTIDARRCISSRTIEQKEMGDESLAGWVFGCDSCQQCCPHNKSTPEATAQDMQPMQIPSSSAEWLAMDEDSFVNLASGRPLKRSSLERIKSVIALSASSKSGEI